jgi:hypothetical protein
VRRWGGNSTTRYNWQIDTYNTGSDWFFENIPNPPSVGRTLPDGSAADQFVEQDRRTGTTTLLTMPLIGWTPKSRAVACGFGVSKYGQQQSTDPWQADCGNGITPGGATITGNDPTDTSVAITPAFVQGWINHLMARYGSAAAGGVRFYDLDHEPMLWRDTHRDVHPTPTSYDEMRYRRCGHSGLKLLLAATNPNACSGSFWLTTSGGVVNGYPMIGYGNSAPGTYEIVDTGHGLLVIRTTDFPQTSPNELSAGVAALAAGVRAEQSRPGGLASRGGLESWLWAHA